MAITKSTHPVPRFAPCSYRCAAAGVTNYLKPLQDVGLAIDTKKSGGPIHLTRISACHQRVQDDGRADIPSTKVQSRDGFAQYADATLPFLAACKIKLYRPHDVYLLHHVAIHQLGLTAKIHIPSNFWSFRDLPRLTAEHQAAETVRRARHLAFHHGLKLLPTISPGAPAAPASLLRIGEYTYSYPRDVFAASPYSCLVPSARTVDTSEYWTASRLAEWVEEQISPPRSQCKRGRIGGNESRATVKSFNSEEWKGKLWEAMMDLSRSRNEQHDSSKVPNPDEAAALCRHWSTLQQGVKMVLGVFTDTRSTSPRGRQGGAGGAVLETGPGPRFDHIDFDGGEQMIMAQVIADVYRIPLEDAITALEEELFRPRKGCRQVFDIGLGGARPGAESVRLAGTSAVNRRGCRRAFSGFNRLFEPNFGFGRSPFHGSREEEDEWEVAYVRGRSRVVLLQVEGCWVWAGERVPVRVNHRHFGRKF